MMRRERKGKKRIPLPLAAGERRMALRMSGPPIRTRISARNLSRYYCR
ncbi:hypothetical protein KCP71_15360 [Salmonella enterica subsp. enterica]|nr:hypothetical protein KCP71_15360 [Salmonella enterica subsp. enterica]